MKLCGALRNFFGYLVRSRKFIQELVDLSGRDVADHAPNAKQRPVIDPRLDSGRNAKERLYDVAYSQCIHVPIIGLSAGQPIQPRGFS